MNSIQERINTINIIVKSISKGYCGDKPVEYVQNMCDVNLMTAIEISKLDIKLIEGLVKAISDATLLTEEFIEKKMNELNFSSNMINYIEEKMNELNFSSVMINYILGKQDIKEPKDDYVVKIGGIEYIINGSIVEIIGIDNQNYLVTDKNCIKCSTMEHTVGCHCRCRKYWPTINDNIDETKKCRFITEVYPSGYHEKQDVVQYAKGINQQTIDQENTDLRLWCMHEDYDITEKYLVLYNRKFNELVIDETFTHSNGSLKDSKGRVIRNNDVDPNNYNTLCKLANETESDCGERIDQLKREWDVRRNHRSCLKDKEGFPLKNSDGSCKVAPKRYVVLDKTEIDGSLKIPLIDGLRMNTLLGIVTVNKVKIAIDYKNVQNWTDEDFDRFALK